MIVLYMLLTLVSLSLLYGPLRAAADPERKHPGRIRIPLALAAAAFVFPLAGALLPDGPACWFFQRWGNVFLGYILYFFAALLLVRLALLAGRLLRKLSKKPELQPSRARSAALLSALVLLTVILNVAGWRISHDVKVTEYVLDKSALGLTQPKRVVLLADLHIGVNSSPELYEDMVELVNRQNADLVVIAGDIFTSSFGALRDPARYASVMRQMQAKDGVYVVYGNHDVDEPLLGGFTYIGAENAVRNPATPGFFEDCGWTLLTDDVLQLPGFDGLWLAGRRDESRPGDGVRERMPLEDLLEGIDPSQHVILLQHEPSELDRLSGLGVDLALSGHTHDGQIFPGNVFTRIHSPQSYGLKDWDGSLVLVTSGVGFYGPSIRIGTISEIVVIDLK